MLPTLAIVVEVAEEGHQFLLVLEQDVQNGLALVRVCHEDLEDVEGLKLNVLGLVAQQVHHQFQIVRAANVRGHHIEVRPVQKKLSQKLAKKKKKKKKGNVQFPSAESSLTLSVKESRKMRTLRD